MLFLIKTKKTLTLPYKPILLLQATCHNFSKLHLELFIEINCQIPCAIYFFIIIVEVKTHLILSQKEFVDMKIGVRKGCLIYDYFF